MMIHSAVSWNLAGTIHPMRTARMVYPLLCSNAHAKRLGKKIRER
jgi:hypothetical protein